eukprot:m.69754 g.69754  ORF g.69754 m.69754 type:complete len:103 (-) comp11646_c1_seq1:150-458(-)
MFFNSSDIHWFKPVELVTKYGRRGHIKASLGTHGHMKCVFDDQLKANDTVMLHLYKRVFPKWRYEEAQAQATHFTTLEDWQQLGSEDSNRGTINNSMEEEHD